MVSFDLAARGRRPIRERARMHGILGMAAAGQKGLPRARAMRPMRVNRRPIV
jgi:hypothetical protein